MTRKPVIANQLTEIAVGAVALVAGALLLWDAYEGRGRRRPFILKFLPGP